MYVESDIRSVPGSGGYTVRHFGSSPCTRPGLDAFSLPRDVEAAPEVDPRSLPRLPPSKVRSGWEGGGLNDKPVVYNYIICKSLRVEGALYLYRII